MNHSFNPDELLTTTRAVRKRLDFDRPLDMNLVLECLQLAIQAPNGSNGQFWHFVIVTDPQKKAKLADIYRKGWAVYLSTSPFQVPPDDKPRGEQSYNERMGASGDYLARNMQRAPILLIPCFAGRVDRAAEKQVIRSSQHVRVAPAGGVELYAGCPVARSGHLLDHAPPVP